MKPYLILIILFSLCACGTITSEKVNDKKHKVFYKVGGIDSYAAMGARMTEKSSELCLSKGFKKLSETKTEEGFGMHTWEIECL